jgi:nitrate reductase NapAB chaperone NapD
MIGVEVHASANTGRMVVTIEADDDQHLLDLITAIQMQDHVINASLVYHQIEDE